MECIISHESQMKNISMASQVVSIAGDLRIMDPVPGLGRFPGGGLGNSFQYSCWSMDRGTWQVTVNRVTKSWTGLKWLCCCSVTQSCPTLCDPMDCGTPGFFVLNHLPEFAQTHVHWVGDTIQPSCPLSSSFPPTFNLSHHQGFFQWVSSSHQVAKVL